MTNIRLTYVTLQVGTWMLNMKVTMESFLFLCAALTKITWIMCLVQTLLRFVLKIFVRCLRAVRLIRAQTRAFLEWYLDSASMFLTYKLYNLLLCGILFALLMTRGSTTFMVRANPYKVGEYGGIPQITRFWKSEIVCDLFTLLGILTLCGQVVGLGFILTKYRYVADNSAMRLLQHRYGITGWDGLMAAQMLGLDPTDPEFLVNGHSRTKLCLGSLLQLLYLSGPSAFVHLAGDYIFHGGGFTKDPVKFRYPVATAIDMGLIETSRYGSGYSTTHHTVDRSMVANTAKVINHVGTNQRQIKTSIFDRELHVVTEGYLGKTLLVDEAQPGLVTTNKESGLREFVVMDALASITILDVKHLLGNERKLRSD